MVKEILVGLSFANTLLYRSLNINVLCDASIARIYRLKRLRRFRRERAYLLSKTKDFGQNVILTHIVRTNATIIFKTNKPRGELIVKESPRAR